MGSVREDRFSGGLPPSFFLRNELPSHTTTPKKVLFRELLHRDWEAARLRLTLYPGDVFYSPEEYGSRRRTSRQETQQQAGVTTCLHVACRNRSPLDIMRRLLDLYPAAVRRQDSEGWTALHTHILHGSIGTAGNPSRDAEFMQAFQMLLEVSLARGMQLASPPSLAPIPSSVASIHAHTTGAPLHLFCCHGHHGSSELALVKTLLRADPSQVTRPDPNGCFPGTLLWRLYRNRYRRFTEDGSGGTAKDPTPEILQILFCFLSAVRGDFCAEKHSLHDVLQYQAKYAGPDRTDFVRLYMQAYPASTRAWNKGQLPVHVAAQVWPRPLTRPTALAVWALAPPGAAVAIDPLWRLLQEVPETAQTVDEIQQRLPLHFALVAPLACLEACPSIAQSSWTPPSSLSEDSGLAALVQAHPSALAVPDPVTGLPAAALVAAVASRIHVTSEKALVGFVFSLLRHAPFVVPSSTR